MTDPALRRVIRRETHSPRTVAAFVAAIVVILVLAYVAVEIVVSLLGRPALLVSPDDAGGFLAGLPTVEPVAAVVAVGVVVAVLGLVFVLLAVTPGRLSKHQLAWGERAVVVDNGVIASALAQHLSEETGLARDRITVGVSHRSVDVTVRPGAGIPLDEAEVRDLATSAVDGYRLIPSVRTRIRVERPREGELVR